MIRTFLGNIKKGGYFKIVESESAPIWVKDEYERTCRRYWVHKYEDINHNWLKGGHLTVWAISEDDLKDKLPFLE